MKRWRHQFPHVLPHGEEQPPSPGEHYLPAAATPEARPWNAWWLIPPGALLPAWLACLCLRAEGMLTWSWWTLTAPIWIPLCALVAIWAVGWIACLFFAVLNHWRGWKYERRRRRDERVHQEFVARMRTGSIHRLGTSGRIEIKEAWKQK